MTTKQTSAGSAATLLEDAFGRVRELVEDLCGDTPNEVLAFRPGPEANPIGWLVWHLARVQDTHIAELADETTAWEEDGWADRFALDLDREATGYDASPTEVAALDGVTADQLDGYHRAVHERTLRYLRTLDDAALARVVDESWDPPVTASSRLVSVIGDCLQHLGQADYVRGLAA